MKKKNLYLNYHKSGGRIILVVFSKFRYLFIKEFLIGVTKKKYKIRKKHIKVAKQNQEKRRKLYVYITYESTVRFLNLPYGIIGERGEFCKITNITIYIKSMPRKNILSHFFIR